MPAIPQVTPRTVHKICEETRAPVAASAAQSRPDCCTAVIYLHTAIHRLCLTSPDVTQISAVTVVRAPTHCCSAGAHRQVAARIPTAPRAKQRTAVLRTVGQACRWTVCSIAVGTALLQAYGRGSSIFRLERGPAHSKPKPCRSNTVDTSILRYCTARRRSVLLPWPAVRMRAPPASMLQLSAVMPRVLT